MLELNKPYNRTEFLNFLERSFLPDDFVIVEEELSISDFKTSFCNEAVKLGSSKTLELDVYEIKHTSSHDARVGISKDAFQILLRKSYNNRALVLFVPEGSKQYRFSLIQIEAEVNDQTARIKRSYSNPRRYSFLLGENAHVKTPEQYLLQKGKLKPKDGDYFKDLQERFSVEVLTKEFYRELSNWYFWAVKKVAFPNDVNDDSDNEKYNTENIIRLITRLIFVWFIKQKELVSSDLFNPEVLKTLLKDFDPESPVQHQYYRAILQNLFFATLNQEVGKRGFAENKGFLKNRGTYNIKNLYRFENEFQCDTQKILQLFSEVPFLNGGLFECLDDKIKDGKTFYWDGFSRITGRQANVPNELFFAKETVVDISKEYNDKKMQSVRVSGIIEILNKYNFTVEENTPVEIEVALDPELLGKVFENLLGAYNPETQETARKQTGSFYTPREIVNYMVNESLIAYYQTKVPDVSEENLRALFSYEDKSFDIPGAKIEALIQATFDCKILDPACGSGAFPMGILQQMVHVLGKLDPNNSFWSRLVLDKSMQEFDDAEKETDEDKMVLQEEIYNTFETHIQFPDYTRKLYLIENCIYGVDIQSIAVQISKLRFFISLICEQKRNSNPEMNYGIRPLPNLETKFVAANTLIGAEKNDEDLQFLKNDRIDHMITQLKKLRHRQFSVSNAQKKKKLRKDDEDLRLEIVNEVARLYKLHADENLNRYKMQLKLAERELEILEKSPDDIRTSTSTDLFGNEKSESYNYTEKRRKELKQQIKMLNNSIEAGSNYSRLNSVVRLAEQLTSWNPYDQNNHSEFFDPEWMFGLKPDENGGGYFDVVIGNPPYITYRGKQIVSISNEELQLLINTYSNSAEYKVNSYALFTELGVGLLRPNGVLNFIIPSTILQNEYLKKIRKYLIQNFHISQIVSFENKVFEAVTDSIILIVENNHSIESFTTVIRKNNLDFTQNNNYRTFKTEIWNDQFNDYVINIKTDDDDCLLLKKIENECQYIDDFLEVYVGIVASGIKKFLSTEQESSMHKKYLQGKHINNFTICPSNLYINFTVELLHSNTDENVYMQNEKILVRKTGNKLIAAIDRSQFYTDQSIYNLYPKKGKVVNLVVLVGLLNSQLLEYYFNKKMITNPDVFPYIKGIHLKKLPIKLPKTNEFEKTIESLVKRIIDLKNDDEKLDYMTLKTQLDLLVYRLYDLTYSEVRVIDPEIEGKISEEEYGRIEIE